MPAAAPKSAQMAKYIVKRLSGQIGRTFLVKLIYLADLHSRELRGQPISELRYHWHHYGPWDGSIQRKLSELVNREVLLCSTVPYGGWYASTYYDGPTDLQSDLGLPESRILDLVIQTYSGKNLKALLDDVVYETPPMKDAIKNKRRGGQLRMSMMDNSKSKSFEPFTFDLIVDRIAGVRAGDVTESFDRPESETAHEAPLPQGREAEA
jgi:hypothetical protein